MSSKQSSHHPCCPVPWDTCRCAVLWAADAELDDPYGLACAYGRFYDPDWESDPAAAPESYGGWSRALPSQEVHR